MAIYRSELSAIVCSVNAGMTPIVAIQSWQGQYSSGYVENLTKKHSDLERLTATERLTQDCMTRARIHRVASKGGFYAMVAKYGADEQERAMAVNELVKLIDCDASSDFKRLIIWTWASISIKRGFIERIVDMCEQSRATIFRKKKIIIEQLNDFEKAVVSDVCVVLGDVCMD